MFLTHSSVGSGHHVAGGVLPAGHLHHDGYSASTRVHLRDIMNEATVYGNAAQGGYYTYTHAYVHEHNNMHVHMHTHNLTYGNTCATY